MLRCKHLLVDLDGTLLGARDIPLRIQFIAKALAAFRKHGSWKQSFRVLNTIYSELGTPSHELTNGERVAKALGELLDLPVREADRILNETVSLIFPQMERYFFPIEGAHDFLNWAKNHYPMTLATNPVWTEEIIHMRMKWANIDPSLFQSVTHSKRMHACKPSLEYYQEILDQEKLHHTECILIGNDPRKDLPATRAGIPVFILSKSNQLQSLELKGQKAKAWKGSFEVLKELLMPEKATLLAALN